MSSVKGFLLVRYHTVPKPPPSHHRWSDRYLNTTRYNDLSDYFVDRTLKIKSNLLNSAISARTENIDYFINSV